MDELIKIIIVDDHQMFIDGIKALLRNEKQFKIIAEANSGEAALALLKQNQPQILITDINMPQMSGIELSRAVKVQYPQVKILVLTMYNDTEVANEIMAVEAEGYILKNTGKAELVSALKALADNSTFYSREVLMQLMLRQKPTANVLPIAELTDREHEILQLICYEYSSEQIAEKLFISKRTVDTHRQHIAEKTGCKTMVALIKYAMRHNLVTF